MKTNTNTVTLYVSTYKKYNEGTLKGLHVEITADSDEDELLNEINEFINEDDPEYMVQDWDFSSTELAAIFETTTGTGESLEIQEIIDILSELDGFSYDLDILAAYSQNFSSGEDISTLISDCEEAYSGQFSSDADFAENLACELGYMNESKSWPFTCIDWDDAARELMYDYFEFDGYYFRNI